MTHDFALLLLRGVITIAMLAMLVANIYYIFYAFRRDFMEGLISLLGAVGAYVLYLLAKVRGEPLLETAAEVVYSLNPLVKDTLGSSAMLIFGYLAGRFYAQTFRRIEYAQFHWILVLVSLMHAVLIDVSLLIEPGISPDYARNITPSVVFVLALIYKLMRDFRSSPTSPIKDYSDRADGKTSAPSLSDEDLRPPF